MEKTVGIIGGGLAGSEAALSLAKRGMAVTLYEMRPHTPTPVHHTDRFAELVCSNSLKSTDPHRAAGMLKRELSRLDSTLYQAAVAHQVPAGGALAVDRDGFAHEVTSLLEEEPLITIVREEVTDLLSLQNDHRALIICTGPLTSDGLADSLAWLIGSESLAFYDAAAPIVMADSLDMDVLFSQSRYEEGSEGDYLNAPFDRERYERFIEELIGAQRVIQKDFETRELFQACQPIEEIARKGIDAPRYGALKPVGLIDPATGKRPWAALQLRKEDSHGASFNLVGFQTNLTFPEQQRVFRMIPGLERAEFARYGVMHRNTYIDAPSVLDRSGRLMSANAGTLSIPVFVAGQLSGTEGYCEAIRSGLNCAISLWCLLSGTAIPDLPSDTAFGALLSYATDGCVRDYQPMHVNFGLMRPLEEPIKGKKERYAALSARGEAALDAYVDGLRRSGYLV